MTFTIGFVCGVVVTVTAAMAALWLLTGEDD